MINKFIDRKNELDALSKAYNAENASLAVIYGRRRIGKTELINQFTRGKKAAYYMATKGNEAAQMQRISAEIGAAIGNQSLVKFGITGWEMLFDALKSYGGGERLIVAIDEFPYLASTNSAIPSIFQSGWDQYMSKANVMLILSGSGISMMHDEVLNYSAPLYGRSSTIIKMGPIPFNSITALMPKDAGFEDKLYTYFIFGGIPSYYKLAYASSIGGVVKEILGNGDLFLNEISLLLSEEVRRDARYIEVLAALANGINKPSEIASKLGIFQSNLDRYLSLLERIGLVKKEYPINTDPLRIAKGGIYVINDPYTYFWAASLNRYRELVGMGSDKAEELLVSSIKTTVAQRRFEDFSKEFIIYLSNKGSIIPITKIGRWRGGDPKKPRGMNQEEIDVVALNENTHDILFAECKWSNSKVDVDVLNKLKGEASLVQWRNAKRKERYALFSKSGFTDDMKEAARNEHVMLFDLDSIEKALGGGAVR